MDAFIDRRFGADSEEKHEPVSDIDTAAADSLKVLDPKRPIREADIWSDSEVRHRLAEWGNAVLIIRRP